MQIISLEAENIKRLRAVRITPTGALVEICGANGQGKTSVLDAIWWALAGVRNIQAEPIRAGQERATVRLDLGDYKVERTFKRAGEDGGEYTTDLRVTAADGRRMPSGQSVLNGLLDSIAFDPLEFSRAGDPARIAALKRLVPGYDFDAADKERREAYDARRDAKRDVARLEAQLSSLPLAPTARVTMSIEDAQKAISAAEETNYQIQREAAHAESLKAQDAALADLEKRLRAELDDVQNKREALMDAVMNLPDQREPIDVAPLREQLQQVAQAAEANAGFAMRERIQRDLAAVEKTAAQHDAAIRAIDDAAAQAIATADLPAGLEFGDDGVRLNGIPFDQASDAERLRASLAIAMAGNPELRVIRIRDGSLLDPAGLAAVGKAAEARDYQIWIERVGADGETGFVIEDGEVAAEPKAPAPKRKGREAQKGGEYRGGPVDMRG